MEILLNIIIGLSALGILILIVEVFISAKIKEDDYDPYDDTSVPKHKKTLTLKTKKKEKNTDFYGFSTINEKNNFQKAQLKARRQGKLQFQFHGEYYPTGLLVINGRK